MKNNLITKIALIVSIIAFLFSIVTLVHIFDTNGNIVMGWIQVVGTGITVAICSIMLYVLSTTVDEEDEEADEEKTEPTEKEEKEKQKQKENDPEKKATEDPDADEYDFKNFE